VIATTVVVVVAAAAEAVATVERMTTANVTAVAVMTAAR